MVENAVGKINIRSLVEERSDQIKRSDLVLIVLAAGGLWAT